VLGRAGAVHDLGGDGAYERGALGGGELDRVELAVRLGVVGAADDAVDVQLGAADEPLERGVVAGELRPRAEVVDSSRTCSTVA
jgi:hypothetical protein